MAKKRSGGQESLSCAHSSNLVHSLKKMPFHYRLLGRDRMALFYFMHSLNTTFGTSIFEPVAEVLSSLNFASAEKQSAVENGDSEKAQREIQEIINELSMGRGPGQAGRSGKDKRGLRQGENEKTEHGEGRLVRQVLCGKVYSELLDCFERARMELKPEIDRHFSKFE